MNVDAPGARPAQLRPKRVTPSAAARANASQQQARENLRRLRQHHALARNRRGDERDVVQAGWRASLPSPCPSPECPGSPRGAREPPRSRARSARSVTSGRTASCTRDQVRARRAPPASALATESCRVSPPRKHAHRAGRYAPARPRSASGFHFVGARRNQKLVDRRARRQPPQREDQHRHAVRAGETAWAISPHARAESRGGQNGNCAR